MVFVRSAQTFRFRVLVVALLVLCTVVFFCSDYYPKDMADSTVTDFTFRQRLISCGISRMKLCYLSAITAQEDNLLEDILLAHPKPTFGHSIFFHETSCRSRLGGYQINPKPINYVNLTARQACAVESAALHNPKSHIFVLFASPAYWDNETTVNPFINAILTYPNVFLRNLNVWSYAAGTPIDDWFKTDELFTSSFVLSHMSDFLRFLTLYRWGGTYLDMDVVVLKNLEKLPPNYTGAESNISLAAGVMNFAYEGIGRKVAEYCLRDFERNFNGSSWANNGPGVITRALKHICIANQISDMFDKKRCLGFKVYDRSAFYAVPWKEWPHFFDKNLTKSTLKRIQKSYVAHVWNKHSIKRKHHIKDRSAYGELAAKHCPKVFRAVAEYF